MLNGEMYSSPFEARLLLRIDLSRNGALPLFITVGGVDYRSVLHTLCIERPQIDLQESYASLSCCCNWMAARFVELKDDPHEKWRCYVLV
jgi:hypothetical protein